MIVGLTGGIGSGKTTVAKLFSNLGVPIYNSDIEAKKIMISNQSVIADIKELLGNEAYKGNLLNKGFISNKIFNNKKLLEELNKIVHPAVRLHFSEWVKSCNSLYVIKEAAILFESGAYKECDAIITVTAPLEERINRVMYRDKISEEESPLTSTCDWEMRFYTGTVLSD